MYKDYTYTRTCIHDYTDVRHAQFASYPHCYIFKTHEYLHNGKTRQAHKW